MTIDVEALDRLAAAVVDELRQRSAAPSATYRVQFQKETFRFAQGAELAPYLQALGVSHLYCSPLLKAKSGSLHCYDVIDFSTLNPEFGTFDDFLQMTEALRSCSVGKILDVVPNHMGIAGGENMYWQDVLENGPSSPYAAYFDIDWRPVAPELRSKLLLPILDAQYGQVLERGAVQLHFEEGAFRIHCAGGWLPLEPKTYRTVLGLRLEQLRESLGEESDGLRELESLTTACDHLPPYFETLEPRVRERLREKEVIKERLARLVSSDPDIARYIDQVVTELNGRPEDPASYDALDRLLDQQVYRLSHWRSAADEINYRRFFDINELAAICMEDDAVFAHTHDLVLDLLARDALQGLRIDHVDGLLDPTAYLFNLQRAYVLRLGRKHYERERLKSAADGDARAAGNAAAESNHAANDSALREEWTSLEPAFLERVIALRPEFGSLRRADGGESSLRARANPEARHPVYVVVEKILHGEERLPPEWPVAGTTGYDFTNRVGGLFVDPRGFREVAKTYRRFTHTKGDFPHVVHDSKVLILDVAMTSELQLLAARLNRLSEADRHTRDFTMNNFRHALREVLACFPVYRTYVSEGHASASDRMVIDRAVDRARRLNPAIDQELFGFIRDMLLGEGFERFREPVRREQRLFVGRFQQTTSPVMAKGVEDTAFYRFFPLASLNEVGGAPDHGGVTVAEFHHQNRQRMEQSPDTLNATTTHDTKRSEDTRARISVLSEIPREWQQALGRWSKLNRKHVKTVTGDRAPSRNDEYLFYQSLVGIWPAEAPDVSEREQITRRLQQYMLKAAHEAKLHSSWINPDRGYDAAVRDFAAAVLDERSNPAFLEDFKAFHERIVDCGLYSALSQVLLKLTSPGIPDIYHGQELWDFSLVDPDNRRPIDFGRRRDCLAEVQRRWDDEPDRRRDYARELASHPRDGRIKMFVTWRTLNLRRDRQRLFERGTYTPLHVEGERSAHVCAFARNADDGDGPEGAAIVIVPRLLTNLVPRDEVGRIQPPVGRLTWQETSVVLDKRCSGRRLTNLFTGEELEPRDRLELAEALADFPVAVLVGEGPRAG